MEERREIERDKRDRKREERGYDEERRREGEKERRREGEEERRREREKNHQIVLSANLNKHVYHRSHLFMGSEKVFNFCDFFGEVSA